MCAFVCLKMTPDIRAFRHTTFTDLSSNRLFCPGMVVDPAFVRKLLPPAVHRLLDT